MNNQIITWISVIKAFLSSSGFHSAFTRLNQTYRNIPIAMRANSQNIDSLIKLSILSNWLVHHCTILPSTVVDSTQTAPIVQSPDVGSISFASNHAALNDKANIPKSIIALIRYVRIFFIIILLCNINIIQNVYYKVSTNW